MEIIVGIGEMAVSSKPEDRIKTFALASCVGLVLYSAECPLLGLAHVALPESRAVPGEAVKRPGKFADTAVTALLKEFYLHGCQNDLIRARLYGAVQNPNMDFYRIALRNLESLKSNLSRSRIRVAAEETGGLEARTITAHVSDGRVEVVRTPLLVYTSLKQKDK